MQVFGTESNGLAFFTIKRQQVYVTAALKFGVFQFSTIKSLTV
jgi:hypothetical protein